jgi:hypothetical protein
MRAAIAAALVLGTLLVSSPAKAQLSTNMQEWMRRLNSPEFRDDGADGGRGETIRRKKIPPCTPLLSAFHL